MSGAGTHRGSRHLLSHASRLPKSHPGDFAAEAVPVNVHLAPGTPAPPAGHR